MCVCVCLCVCVCVPVCLCACVCVAPQKHFGVSVPLHSMRGYSVELSGCEGPVPTCPVADDGSGALRFQILPLGGGTIRLIGFAEMVDTLTPDPTLQDMCAHTHTHSTPCPLLCECDCHCAVCGLGTR